MVLKCFATTPKKKKRKESEVAQSRPTLCEPMNCSLPGSSVNGIFQARVLEWVAISYCRRSSTQLYYSCKGGGLITFKASRKVKRQK